MKLADRSIFVKTRGGGILTHAIAVYSRPEGVEQIGYITGMTRSDTTDFFERRFSSDNGRTWTQPEPVEIHTATPRGMYRRGPNPPFVDPVNGRMLTMVVEGLLPTDNPKEGMKNWFLSYQVSTDGGRTAEIEERVIQKGHDPDHPFECVWIGKNCMMIGDKTCRPIRTREGVLLVPVQVTPVGPDGEYYNPTGGTSYHEAAVLIGTWHPDGRIEWDLSQRVANDPDRSTRGCVEPTVAELPDGRILMVLRGSNDVKPELPAYKWVSVSTDGGRTWSAPEPWTYADKTNFFSPSSCSQLIRHSNGTYYWIGNITPENPKGNRPRYPMVIGRVDPDTGLLIRDTVTVVDDKAENDDPDMTLSNFIAHEDRETGQIVLYMSRPFARAHRDWTSDAYIYHIDL